MTLKTNGMTFALLACRRLFTEALPKFNWGASALDANAITLLNQVPRQVDEALDSISVENLAQELVYLAQVNAQVVTIELVPIRPWAMGRYETLITVRPARGCSGDIQTTTVPMKE